MALVMRRSGVRFPEAAPAARHWASKGPWLEMDYLTLEQCADGFLEMSAPGQNHKRPGQAATWLTRSSAIGTLSLYGSTKVAHVPNHADPRLF